MTDVDPFEVLDLGRSATDEEIREAGFVLGQRWRVRRQNARDAEAALEAEQQEEIIREAVRVLLDPEARQTLEAMLDGEAASVVGGLISDDVADPAEEAAAVPSAEPAVPVAVPVTHKPCRACAEPILFEAVKCRHCGTSQVVRAVPRELAAVLVLAACGALFGYLERDGDRQAPPPAAAAWTPPPEPVRPAARPPDPPREAPQWSGADSGDEADAREVEGDARSIEAVVEELLRQYVATTDDIDPAGRASLYSPVLDSYFGMRNVPRERVRSDMAKVADRFPEKHYVWVEDVSIGSRGETEVVVRFRKRWDFVGPDRLFNGEEKVRMKIRREPEGWRIASEDEETVYRVEKKALWNGVWRNL